MKICRFIYKGEVKSGFVKDELIYLLEDAQKNTKAVASEGVSASFKISDVQFLPPCAPTKIVCVGRNYAEHAAELGNETPVEPLIFLKAVSSLITDGEKIVLPKQSNRVEHEGELGVIIGRDCKNIADDVNVFDYVFGFICLNDVTARDIQRRDVQFTRAKSFDTFCPVGAFAETEIDPSDLLITTKVNGVVKQTGRTSQMVFSVPFLIRYISNQMTLKTGDIIATGTPAGVSKLEDGDVCEVEIEDIGILRNVVSASSLSSSSSS